MFIKLFAGVPRDTFDSIPLVSFGRWLLPVGAILLWTGSSVEKNDRIACLSGYRYGTALNWWKMRYWKGLVSGMGKAVLLLSAVYARDLAVGGVSALHVGEAAPTVVLWLLHIISLDAVFLFLDLISAKRFIPATLILFEGATFLLGNRVKAVSHAMYGMWGMYLRSSWHGAGGFPAGAVITAELLLTAAVYGAGGMYLKKMGKGGF